MISLQCLQSVSERDIDLLVVEELESSEQFRAWLATRVYGTVIYKGPIGAWHSVNDPKLGESDLIFLFTDETDGEAAILIENKIDAPPQPEQGQRYQQRGRKGEDEGLWNEFRTCVIAPKKYLESATHTEQYDAEISYQEILAFFASRRSIAPRFAHKAKVIQEGIEQNRRGYQPKTHPGLSRFVQAYYDFCTEQFPELGMEPPRARPAQSTWINFNPKGLPNNSYITHQTTAGLVKLFFRAAAAQFEELSASYLPRLGSNMEIGATGKSVAITVAVPVIDNPWEQAFSDYSESATQALKRVTEIIAVVKQVQADIL